MKTTRNKQQRAGVIRSGSDLSLQDPVEVFCRVRPLRFPATSCLKVLSNTTVQFSPPEGAVTYRNGNNFKQVQYTFKQVFDDNTTQKEVFESVGLHLVRQLIAGKNGLLFAYGVTGSGKTFTMTGEPQNPGVMPRCLEVIFNSISEFQAKKFIFRPNKMNGFEIGSEEDADLALRKEMLGFVQPKTPKTPRRKDGDGDIFFCRDPDSREVLPLDESNMFSCFVTYIEIYNNSVFDLLDTTSPDDRQQNKMIREGANKTMYVHDVTEVEVKSPEEALEVFSRGQRRKRVGQTLLNEGSSRSHSVFTIRLVQADVEGKSGIRIGQLSLVDLAGSERTNRTKNTGQRLREAGSINNSLMTLRTCLEILRENQQTGNNKIVPYRDSKLTHLFKSYFDGEGSVRMIVCVNPRVEDYDETAQVLKFAELTQEVQVTRPTPLRFDVGMTPSRRRAQLFKRDDDDVELRPVLPSIQSWPNLLVMGYNDEETFRKLENYLTHRESTRNSALSDLSQAEEALRRELMRLNSDSNTLVEENTYLKSILDSEKIKGVDVENKLAVAESEKRELAQKLSDRDQMIRNLQVQIDEKDFIINRQGLEKEKVKEKCHAKLQQKEKKFRQVQKQIIESKEALEDLRRNEEKFRQIKEVLADNTPMPPRPHRAEYPLTPKSVNSAGTLYQPPASVGITSRGPAVSNFRHRRSRSAGGGERWLDHRPAQPVELGTVFQPSMRKRKSITKLMDMKDVVNSKTSKYCLTTQEQDTDGELETKLYKGDVIPTCTGGAQVVLNDVETLKQSSPTAVGLRKRSVPDENTEARCRIAVEGHEYLLHTLEGKFREEKEEVPAKDVPTKIMTMMLFLKCTPVDLCTIYKEINKHS